jgi:hypothetical protein
MNKSKEKHLLFISEPSTHTHVKFLLLVWGDWEESKVCHSRVGVCAPLGGNCSHWPI